MLHETLDALAIREGSTVIDATVGRGGHSEAIARRLGGGRLVLLDRDRGNLEYASARVRAAAPACEVMAHHANFCDIGLITARNGIVADALLADLGVASTHLDESLRGFGFQHDGPLDMRLDPSSSRTAADLIRDASEAELADIIFHLGEEPFARRIARKVAQVRESEPIKTTAQLARLVREAYGSRARASRLHPATRTFMALRIAVNDELGALEALLLAIASAARARGSGWLALGARVAIISFHSLEDRQVKRMFAALSDEGVVKRLSRKPLIADDPEVARNPRARSAKLRTISLTDTEVVP
jgi:16S rRNA (cytosine1402-N4)-methyltransferase